MKTSDYPAIFQKVLNRGSVPVEFVEEIVSWAQATMATKPEVFDVNASPRDIYATVKGKLGPYEQPKPEETRLRRVAVMLEVMRVHAGFESSWDWNEGVDRNNHQSMAHKEGEETGAFQVSFDSTRLADNAMLGFAQGNGIADPDDFIAKMKTDHRLALNYYARLIRGDVSWAGPIKRHEIDQYLSVEAVEEFEALIQL